MNGLDRTILLFVNGFAHKSSAFDAVIAEIEHTNFLKGGILMALFWWAWFTTTDHERQRLRSLSATFAGCLVAVVVGRGLALVLPFRLRPVYAGELNFQLPYHYPPQVTEGVLQEWSAFPSDHAVLFFSLAAGLWLVSRLLGTVAIAYVAAVICFPRIYLGLHYPTDVIGGAVIAMGILWLVHRPVCKNFVAGIAAKWLTGHAGSFYACFFLVSFQVATLFTSARDFASFVLQSLPAVFR